MTEEVRATDPNTGAQKGRKPQAYSLLPVKALAKVAEVYNFGATKYAPDNWRAGYPWSWSQDAKGRHSAAYWSGEDLDPESGLPHLAHEAFHVLTQLEYYLTNTGTDDRWKYEGSEGGRDYSAVADYTADDHWELCTCVEHNPAEDSPQRADQRARWQASADWLNNQRCRNEWNGNICDLAKGHDHAHRTGAKAVWVGGNDD